ncbi:MAG TPA: proprotein convertase P-domain-containing protein [Thermoanaerobaculia bacterium]|nr:proprotein convertase P-domain-containing protein [Thermoanaerobaculia bacterium]
MLPRLLRSRSGLWLILSSLLVLVSAGERSAWAGLAYGSEVEPNGTSATATPIAGTNALIKANIFLGGDQDVYSFTAAAGDRVYAATQTSFSASASTDSVIEILDVDGTTVLEGDEDDGSFGTLSSTVANRTLPAAGTYFLRVRHSTATGQLRPYYLHFQLRSGSPTPETEPNDTLPGQALPASGWVSGSASAAADIDFFSINLNAGDSVYLSLDLDPERNGDANLQLGFGTFDGFVLLVNDSGAGFAPYTAPDSEAYFMTVKDAGTYSIFVGVPTTGGVPGTYTLSATVYPNATEGVNCTTYTSTDVPKAIPDSGIATSTLTVPGNPRIADVNVAIQLNHTFMQDLDFHLISPANNDNGFFSDVFNNATAGPMNMNLIVDDEGAIPPAFTVSSGMVHQPELNYRLGWYDGENGGGTWTLAIRDDFAADTGTLTGWSLTICEPPPSPACVAGFTPVTVFSTDFEAGAAGFTHSGTQDEWELGLPATAATTTANPVAPFTTCNSGTSCWKTDLDNTYNASSTQDLVSPAIDLTGLSGPVVVSWAHRYQMDTATNDHYNVSIRQAGNPASAVRLFEFLDAVMTDAVGTPVVNIGESAGWGTASGRADAFAGQSTELVFHLDSGAGVTNFGGAAIDDVTVTACMLAAIADLSITKTDGVATAVPGGSVIYTITAANSSGTGATGATVADTFPATLTCIWTCTGAGGGTCTAAGSGNINDSVNLPNGASVTYTASCTIDPAATGTLSNTATVTLAGDPNTANDSATDTDTLGAQADLSITKTDGVTSATPGGSLTYTIVASNAGPSNAPGSTVADTFPASLTCTWTCAGAGGGTCTAAGSGNINDTVNLPAGGSVTYTASCAVSLAATGTIVNTATVSAAAGITDPTPGNDSATDTDTVGAAPGAAVSGTKTASAGPYTVGGTLTYTVTLTNAGPGVQSDNPGNEFTDVLPPTLALVSATASSGAAVATVGTNTVTWNGAIAVAGSVTITINATILPSAAGTSVSNQGTISFDDDGNGTNNATAQTDDPAATGTANPTTIAVAGGTTPSEIPTLSSLGLMLLATALAGLALLLMKRRQRV